MFTTQFDKYTCVNDSITCTIGKFTFVATVHHDSDSRPEDCECYSEEDLSRWKNDEWFYCGIVVTCKYNDIPLDYCESLWGIDTNFGDDNSYLLEVANDLLNVQLAESALSELRNALV